MQENIYDVIVVGAGPSGSSAAIVCAMNGLRTAIIDKEKFPRVKACGDAVPADFMYRIRALGVKLQPDDYHTVDSVQVYGPYGTKLKIPLTGYDGQPHAIVTREILDDRMRQCALDYKAEAIMGQVTSLIMKEDKVIGVNVRLLDSQSDIPFYAKVVIAADGAKSKIARTLWGIARPPEHALAIARRGYIHTTIEMDHTIEFAFLRDMQPGYGWMFPAVKNTVNVGVGIRADYYKKSAFDLQTLLNYYIYTLRDRLSFETPPEVFDVRTWQLPLYYTYKQLPRTFNGALLVGDAGYFIDSVTGAGINTGSVTGILAAEVVVRAIAKGDVSKAELSLYDEKWRHHEKVGLALRKGTFYHKLFSWMPWLMDGAIMIAQYYPPIVSAVIGKV